MQADFDSSPYIPNHPGTGIEMPTNGSEINYMSHWLENGFDGSNIPESLF